MNRRIRRAAGAGAVGMGQEVGGDFEVVDYKWDEDEYIAEKAVLKYSEQVHADP